MHDTMLWDSNVNSQVHGAPQWMFLSFLLFVLNYDDDDYH